jgi:hypothetical protein
VLQDLSSRWGLGQANQLDDFDCSVGDIVEDEPRRGGVTSKTSSPEGRRNGLHRGTVRVIDHDILIGISLMAAVGGGARAAIVFWALSRGEAHPPRRARLVAIAFGVVAILGLIGLIVAALTR